MVWQHSYSTTTQAPARPLQYSLCLPAHFEILRCTAAFATTVLYRRMVCFVSFASPWQVLAVGQPSLDEGMRRPNSARATRAAAISAYCPDGGPTTDGGPTWVNRLSALALYFSQAFRCFSAFPTVAGHYLPPVAESATRFVGRIAAALGDGRLGDSAKLRRNCRQLPRTNHRLKLSRQKGKSPLEPSAFWQRQARCVLARSHTTFARFQWAYYARIIHIEPAKVRHFYLFTLGGETQAVQKELATRSPRRQPLPQTARARYAA